MEKTVAYRTYWAIWVLLLLLTILMMGLELAPLPRLLAVLVLLAAMFVKAGAITGWFMHLKFERRALGLAIVLGTLLTAAVLFALIAVDGARTLELQP